MFAYTQIRSRETLGSFQSVFFQRRNREKTHDVCFSARKFPHNHKNATICCISENLFTMYSNKWYSDEVGMRMHAGVIQKRGSDVAWMASFIIQSISNPVLPDANEIPILQSRQMRCGWLPHGWSSIGLTDVWTDVCSIESTDVWTDVCSIESTDAWTDVCGIESTNTCRKNSIVEYRDESTGARGNNSAYSYFGNWKENVGAS